MELFEEVISFSFDWIELLIPLNETINFRISKYTLTSKSNSSFNISTVDYVSILIFSEFSNYFLSSYFNFITSYWDF